MSYPGLSSVVGNVHIAAPKTCPSVMSNKHTSNACYHCNLVNAQRELGLVCTDIHKFKMCMSKAAAPAAILLCAAR